MIQKFSHTIVSRCLEPIPQWEGKIRFKELLGYSPECWRINLISQYRGLKPRGSLYPIHFFPLAQRMRLHASSKWPYVTIFEDMFVLICALKRCLKISSYVLIGPYFIEKIFKKIPDVRLSQKSTCAHNSVSAGSTLNCTKNKIFFFLFHQDHLHSL